MPRGDKDAGSKIGHETRFNGETAAIAGKKSAEARLRRKTIREITIAALYGKPSMLTKEQLKIIAKYYGCKSAEITVADVAIFRQIADAIKGDRAALQMLVEFAGENPVKVELNPGGDFTLEIKANDDEEEADTVETEATPHEE